MIDQNKKEHKQYRKVNDKELQQSHRDILYINVGDIRIHNNNSS